MNSFWLSLGMFSVFPVPKPRPDVTPTTAGRGLRWLPLVGGLIGIAAAIGALLVWHGNGQGGTALAATVVVALQALLTRGLHLDGLADLADGLGSRRPAPQALQIMRKSDIGPFGVGAVLLSLLLQVTATATILQTETVPVGIVAVVSVPVVARLAVLHAAGPNSPSAREQGFGALVAGSVSPVENGAISVAVTAVTVAATALAGGDFVHVLWFVAAAAAGLVAAAVIRRHVIRRLGGMTGDVFGALIELTATSTLIVLAAEHAWR